ncbi:uncharacterized protein [Malus domestica]|uniref:uncharacterized protein n=1 Tax=Malus domestica TaxID=3750 RepID=UPI003977068A
MPSDSEEEEEKDSNQKKNNNKDKSQSSQGPRKTQCFKRSGTSSNSSSGSLSSTAPRRGGRFLGGSSLGHFARVLIDCGATHFVISNTFAQTTRPHPTPLGYELEFSMPRGETCYVSWVYQGCSVLVENVVVLADLVSLDIVDLDVILGMDWLYYNRAKMDCYGKTITFHRPGLPMVTFVGKHSGVRHDIISTMRAKRLLRNGCQGYLVHMVLNVDTPISVEDVRVVGHFPDVFPDDLPGLPLVREVEFTIDLLPGIDFISLTPYRMSPAELRELKIQLQELVDKGFIQPSTSP